MDPTRPTEAARRPVRVVYVVGKGRSGSTLVDDLLGTMPGVGSLGELHQLWRRGFGPDYRCTCGALVAECPLWTTAVQAAAGETSTDAVAAVDRLRRQVLRWPHVPRALIGPGPRDRALGEILGRLYAAAADHLTEETGEPVSVLVDSTKWPLHPGIVGAVPGIEAWVLHLVRDPRAVAHSYRRRVEREGQPALPRFGATHTALSWLVRNLGAEVARAKVPAERTRRLRYEDLVASPRATIVDLGRWLGIEDADRAFSAEDRVALAAGHLVAGNPRRLTRGTITIAPDDEWRRSGSARVRRVVSATTAPLRRRYGYGSRHMAEGAA